MRLKRTKKVKQCLIATIFSGCLLILCAGGASGCAQGTAASADILTQKVTSAERTPITVLVKYAFSINAFETAVEEKFPNIDLIQVGNYTCNMGIAEYESRLKHDDLTDVVMTWPLDVGEQYWGDRLLDLSGFYFTRNYNLSMLNSIARDGKLYYLPGPSQVRGILYNKTLFQENGWQLPTNYNEFLALCQAIEKSGMRSLQLGLGNAEVLDTAFIGYNYANSYSHPQDAQWMSDYNAGKGSFSEHFLPALDTFQQLIDAGILQPNDLNVTYSEREVMLFNRQCAMTEDSVLLARMGNSLTGTTDEFALMPFFNPDDSDWARLYMVCYIGLNKHLAEVQNKQKYDLVLELMDYISTPEGQQALMGDTGAMYSSLLGVEPPEIPEIEALVPALMAGRYAIFPQLKNAQQALREGLAGMVRGEVTAQEVCSMVDAQNIAPPVIQPPRVLGTAKTDFSLIETGNLVADSIRAAGKTDIALFLDNGKDGKYNGMGVSGRLYEGDITEADIARILPDLKHGNQGALQTASITGADLLTTLEHSILVDHNEDKWFYYFSGLRMEYDVAALPGSRIGAVTTEGGKELDPQGVYTLTIMEQTVPEQFLISPEDLGLTVVEVLTQMVEEKNTIEPSKDGRFVYQ